MITGGYGPRGALNMVQLFNWKTQESCQLPALPYYVSGHSLITELGAITMCGGSDPGGSGVRATCYKLNSTNNSWTQVNQTLLFLQLVYISYRISIGMLIWSHVLI